MLSNCGFEEDSWESFDCKEIKRVNPKGNQPWIFIGGTDTEAEAPILWPPDVEDSLPSEPPRKPYPISVEDPYPGGYSVSHVPSKQALGPENRCVRKHLQQGRSTPVPSLCQLSAETMDFVLNHKLAEVTALSHNNEELNLSSYYRPGTILSTSHTLQHSFSLNPHDNPKR